ncbi:hypothetical protein Tco_1113421 [Tanacetum coccineum]|uniref:Zinc finger, CCHC-type n=1 Tax=Tanacetum coccineum TaxID=301880 RepID=A0ABQ5IS36_9ASTR
MFQQHHGESLSEAWTRFKDLLQKVPHHGIDLWLQVQIFYDHVNPVTRRTIDQSASGKLRDLNTEESWAFLEDLALYDNENWNDPRDIAKPVKEIALPQDVLMVPMTLSIAWKTPNKPLLTTHPRVPMKREVFDGDPYLDIHYHFQRTIHSGMMEIKHDIENMTPTEYFEYEAEKERRSWRNVQSKSSPTRKAREEDGDDGDIYDIWDITVEDVEQIRQFLTPNVPDVMDDVIQPLIPKTIHTTSLDEDYVAPDTKSILDELLEEFRDEILNVTMVDDTTTRRWDLRKPSRDFTRPLRPPSSSKGLLHMLNATVIPMKAVDVKVDVARGSRLEHGLEHVVSSNPGEFSVSFITLPISILYA